MVKSFRHRGLKRLYQHNDPKGVAAPHADKLRRILTLLDAAELPSDVDLPGFRLHPLKGDRKGEWSIVVSGNWRVTWRFEGRDVVAVGYEDYHGK